MIVASLLQHLAGDRIGGENPGFEALVVKAFEGVAGEAAQGLGGETLAPVLFPQPVADLGGETRDVRQRLESDSSDRLTPALDGEGLVRLGMKRSRRISPSARALA